MTLSAADIVRLKAKVEVVVRGKYESQPADFVDDVVAETFLALQELDETALDGIRNLEAYAGRIALNKASDLWASKTRYVLADGVDADSDKQHADAYVSPPTFEKASEYSGVGRPRERRFSDPEEFADHLDRKCNDIFRQELGRSWTVAERDALRAELTHLIASSKQLARDAHDVAQFRDAAQKLSTRLSSSGCSASYSQLVADRLLAVLHEEAALVDYLVSFESLELEGELVALVWELLRTELDDGGRKSVRRKADTSSWTLPDGRTFVPLGHERAWQRYACVSDRCISAIAFLTGIETPPKKEEFGEDLSVGEVLNALSKKIDALRTRLVHASSEQGLAQANALGIEYSRVGKEGWLKPGTLAAFVSSLEREPTERGK